MSSGQEGTGWACWWLSSRLGVRVRDAVRGGGGKKRRKGKRKRGRGRKMRARERMVKRKARSAERREGKRGDRITHSHHHTSSSSATCPARVGCFLTSLSLTSLTIALLPFSSASLFSPAFFPQPPRAVFPGEGEKRQERTNERTKEREANRQGGKNICHLAESPLKYRHPYRPN